MSVLSLLAWRLFAGALQIDAGPDGIVEVVWRGCEAELSGPRCVTKKGDELVLWTRLHTSTQDNAVMVCDASSRIGVTGRGHTAIATGHDDRGCWTLLRVDSPSGVLELRNTDDRLLWSLPFVTAPMEDTRVTEARVLFEAGYNDEAKHLLQAVQIGPQVSEADALTLADALNLERKIALRSDDFFTGVASARAAHDLYQSLGWVSSACDITFALVDHYWDKRHDKAATLLELQASARCAAAIPHYAINQRYYEAVLIEGRDDPLDTSLAYRGIDVLARRIQDFDFEAAILSAQHVVAEQLHLREETQRIEERMYALESQLDGRSSCGLVNALSNLGWSVLMRRERGESTEDPRRVLATVHDRFRVGPCRSVDDLRNATINLALAELQHDDLAAAKELLNPLEADPRVPEGELWRHLILARANLAQHNLELARGHSTKIDELAFHHADPYFKWHAAMTRGDLYAETKDSEQAIAAYQEGELLRDEMALSLALGAGLERAGARWDDSARRLINLQIEQGRPEAALRTARLARRRALRAVEELAALSDAQRDTLVKKARFLRKKTDEAASHDGHRTRAELEQEFKERRQELAELRRDLDHAVAHHSPASVALREPTSGELLLVYYPLGERWVGFAADGEQVITTFIRLEPEMSDEDLGEVLYEPFAAAIAEAREVRIIATGALLMRDLHGLPHRGKPLLARVPVAYAFDLPESLIARPRPLRGGLIVAANPGGEIPLLRFVDSEADNVADQWSILGLGTTRLVGPTAIRDAVLRELPHADVFHFIGHHIQRSESSRSTNAWDHVLILEDGTSVSVEDIMLIEGADMPRVAFLSACQTGMIDPEVASGGAAIGHSFLLRGAALVIATARPVDDAEAARVAGAFYMAAPDNASLADPATLAEAQLDLLEDGTCSENPGICAFRAWVP